MREAVALKVLWRECVFICVLTPSRRDLDAYNLFGKRWQKAIGKEKRKRENKTDEIKKSKR